MTGRHVFQRLAAAALAATSAAAPAQLTLRLDPEVEDPGTSSMPARVGYANSGRGQGAATQLAITYGIVKGLKGGGLIYEPYAALTINDNPATVTDKKAGEIGVKSVYGDVTQGTAWLVDGQLSRSRDNGATTSSSEVALSAEPVASYLKFGLGYTAGKWGLFVRPKAKLYYLNTLESDDPVKAPEGEAGGVAAEIALDLFLPFSDRMKVTLSGLLASDQVASGDRIKDNYRKGKAQLEYAFYNAAEPPKGKALFSVVLERSIGRDPLSTSTDKKASSGLFLAAKL